MQILSLINDYNGFLAIIDVWTLNLKHSCELQQSQTETTIKKKWQSKRLVDSLTWQLS